MFTRPTLAIPPRIRVAQMLAGQRRMRSNSPYGRSHVPNRQKRLMPNPVVPHFPQIVYYSDGSTITQYTTSPDAEYKMARDMHNNPLYNPSAIGDHSGDESELGRLGRFRRRFAGAAQVESEPSKDGQPGTLFKEGDLGWYEEMSNDWGEKPEKEKGKE
ncbi:hypothetical protein CALCODRAFT_497170 [Calocera cornea HHB12733]|uniref:Ribosomal protein bL31m N-terminal domain-containing protein n=1 Tax=Calocera cornea HHB12733 TaxID=1353952 RepID=A0A165FFL7_9BASI|nr:hypothetical protein CALCODRAFT_497170 [Calocera cornea HHB12733]